MADTVYELVARISVDSSGVDQGLTDARQQIENSGVQEAAQSAENSLRRTSTIATAAVVAGGAAIVKGLISAGKTLVGFSTDAAAYADNLLTMSSVTGLSTEALQEYTYMAELVDVSVDTITGSMARLTKTMASARDGSEKEMAAFKKLGVQVTDSEGRLRDNNDVFLDVVDALNGMEEGAERDAIIMEIFGRSAQQLNPLIAQGRKGIERFAEEARELGFVLDDETLASLGALDDTMQRLQNAKLNIKNQLGIAMAPALERVLDKLLEVSARIDWATIGEKLGTAIEKIADILIHFLETADIDKMIAGAETLFEGLITGLSWVLENADRIISVVQTIARFFFGGAAGQAETIGPAAIAAQAETVMSATEIGSGHTLDEYAANANRWAAAEAKAAEAMEAGLISGDDWADFVTAQATAMQELEAALSAAGIKGRGDKWLKEHNGDSDLPEISDAEFEQIRAAWGQIELDATTTSQSVETTLGGLAENSATWGSDMAINMANGFTSSANSTLLPAIVSVAGGIASLLHHSEPDLGPLAHDSEWMPDMMAGFAKGIRDNRGMVLGELDSLAADMNTSMSAPAPSVSGFGGVGGGNVINFAPSIHIDGDITDPRKTAEELMVYMREIFIREAYA